LLIRAGSLTWYGDPDGKRPLDYARIGVARDKNETGSRLDSLISEPFRKLSVRGRFTSQVIETGNERA
jgi:hypothetical protein